MAKLALFLGISNAAAWAIVAGVIAGTAVISPALTLQILRQVAISGFRATVAW